MRAFRQQRPDAPEYGAPEDGPRMDALRSWLANGIHKFAVDPRRRRGRHGRARQLLAEDVGAAEASGQWQSLASALHRHTVRAGMAELTAEEKRVITLAYLEGRTNPEIAAVLGVSVSTVTRRLWTALKRLEAYMSRTGTWLSAILLLGAAYVIDRTTRFVRAADAEWTHKLASSVAVGAVAATAIGLTAIIPDSTSPMRPSIPTTLPTIAAGPTAGAPVSPGQGSNARPPQTASIVTADRSSPISANVMPIKPVKANQPETGTDYPNHGCGGNPTSAAPSVPVGRHSNGAPVSHPSKGGCRV